jgi:hypothetical protein
LDPDDVFPRLKALGDRAAFRLNLLGHESGAAGRDVVEGERWSAAPTLTLGLSAQTINDTSRRDIARLNGDGSLDSSFDPGAAANRIAYSVGNVYSVGVQPDGKVLIAGAFTFVNGEARWSVARLFGDPTAIEPPGPHPGQSQQAP